MAGHVAPADDDSPDDMRSADAIRDVDAVTFMPSTSPRAANNLGEVAHCGAHGTTYVGSRDHGAFDGDSFDGAIRNDAVDNLQSNERLRWAVGVVHNHLVPRLRRPGRLQQPELDEISGKVSTFLAFEVVGESDELAHFSDLENSTYEAHIAASLSSSKEPKLQLMEAATALGLDEDGTSGELLQHNLQKEGSSFHPTITTPATAGPRQASACALRTDLLHISSTTGGGETVRSPKIPPLAEPAALLLQAAPQTTYHASPRTARSTRRPAE